MSAYEGQIDRQNDQPQRYHPETQDRKKANEPTGDQR
jgi:hypothetical protein